MRLLKLISEGISLPIRDNPNPDGTTMGSINSGTIIVVNEKQMNNYYELFAQKGFVQNNAAGTSWLVVTDQLTSSIAYEQKQVPISCYEFGILEKKGWAGLVYRPWNQRYFQYDPVGKLLEYFDLDRNKRGVIILSKDSEITIIESTYADGKEFAFAASGVRIFPKKRADKLILSASCYNQRSQVMSILLESLRDDQSLLDDYFLIECMERFKSQGPGSLLSYDFANGQLPTVFGIPKLRAKCWWEQPRADILLETHFDVIKGEFLRLLKTESPTPRRHRNLRSGQWSVFPLLEKGVWNQQNCSACPMTACLLRELPICFSSFGNAYFSVLAAGTVIASHSGPSNTKLCIHLPIIVPHAKSSITVGGTTKVYEEGLPLIFDSSYEHSVRNDGETNRIVLLVDIWHPQLSNTAKTRLEAFFDIQRIQTPDFTLCNHLPPFCEISAASSYRLKPAEDGCPIEYAFQFLVVGDTGVGKSCFASRFADPTAPIAESHVPTQNVSFNIRSLNFQQANCKLQLWDMCAVTPYYYGLCQGVFICIDPGSPGWYKRLTTWHEDIKKHAPAAAIVIVSMKADLPRTPGSQLAQSTPPQSPSASPLSSRHRAWTATATSLAPTAPNSPSQPQPRLRRSQSQGAADKSHAFVSKKPISSQLRRIGSADAVTLTLSDGNTSVEAQKRDGDSTPRHAGDAACSIDSSFIRAQMDTSMNAESGIKNAGFGAGERQDEAMWINDRSSDRLTDRLSLPPSAYWDAAGRLNPDLECLAARLRVPCVECSSRTGRGVDFCVATLLSHTMNNMKFKQS